MNPDYGKIYTTEVYYKGKVAGHERWLEQQIKTDKHNFLKHYLDCVADTHNGLCAEVEVKVKSDAQGPYMIITKRLLDKDRGTRV